MRTPTHQLADFKLGSEGALEEFVRARRREERSWRLISRDLYEQTGLDVTHETLRAWFPDQPAEAAS